MTQSLPAKRRWLIRLASALGAASLGRALPAQGRWPARPIRVVVGFAAGGTTDVLARIVAQGLGEALGQAVIVDNKPGASGNLAVREVIQAAGDGYTLLIAPTSVETANPSLFKVSFHPARDLAPVASLGRTAMYLVARPGFPADDARALVALAKAQPGTLSYASAGAGTPPHLAAELFRQQAGIDATHIPYRGAAPALQDVMAGQADYVFDPGIAFPHIRAGKVKLLGVISPTRSPFFPDVPTLAEQGIHGAELDIWFGLWSPPGVPAEAHGTLVQALARVLALDATRQRFAELGAEPQALDPTQFRSLLDDEGRLLTALIRDRKITVD